MASALPYPKPIGANNQLAQRYVTNVDGTGRYEMTGNAPDVIGARSYISNAPSNDAPVKNAAGLWVSSLTGKPYHGSYNNGNGTSMFFSNGQQVQDASKVGSLAEAQPDFGVVRTVKNPAITGQVDSAISNNAANQAALTKTFNDYLNEAKQVNLKSASQLQTDQQAVDPTQTIDRLNAGAAKTTADLNNINRSYGDAATRISGDVAANTRDYTTSLDNLYSGLTKNTADTAANLTGKNADYEANQRAIQNDVGSQARAYTGSLSDRLANLEKNVSGTTDALRQNNADYRTAQTGVQSDIVNQNDNYQSAQAQRLAQLKADLDAERANYQTAAQGVAQQAYDKARKHIALYQLSSGTPTSGSGNLDNRYIRAYSDINIPLQQDLANRDIAQTNQLYGLGANLTDRDYQNRMNQYAGASSLNTDLANRSGTTEQYLSDLYGRTYNAGNAADLAAYNANLGVDSSASALESDLNNRGTNLQQYLASLYGQNYNAGTSTAGNVFNANNAASANQAGVASDLANRAGDTARYAGSLDAQTATQIAQLKQATAGMSRTMASQYLQQLGIPIQVAQQVMAGNIANLSALQGLDERANAYTFTTPYQSSRIPVTQNFNTRLPARSYVGGNNTATSGGGVNLSNVGDFSQRLANDFNQSQAPLAARSYTTTASAPATAAPPAPNFPDPSKFVDQGNGTYLDENTGRLYKPDSKNKGKWIRVGSGVTGVNALSSGGDVVSRNGAYTPEQEAAIRSMYQ